MGHGKDRREKFRAPGQKFLLGSLVSGTPKSSDEQKKVIASADVWISARNQKNIIACGEAKNFKRRGAIIFTFFKRIFFFGRTNVKLIEKQERGHAPPKNFENLYAVMAILVLFE